MLFEKLERYRIRELVLLNGTLFGIIFSAGWLLSTNLFADAINFSLGFVLIFLAILGFFVQKKKWSFWKWHRELMAYKAEKEEHEWPRVVLLIVFLFIGLILIVNHTPPFNQPPMDLMRNELRMYLLFFFALIVIGNIVYIVTARKMDRGDEGEPIGFKLKGGSLKAFLAIALFWVILFVGLFLFV
ncbi:hypothetical protein ACE1TH_18855 [Shouchella sp. JSM 1781072]|uniref:hypothetical protein n=1 Tax=Shouchella sp. JSM 1781072 TaxID=3344581 RepID=UPI0035C1C445